MAKVAMLGAGFIGDFYTFSINGHRNRDKVHVIYSRDEGKGESFCKKALDPEMDHLNERCRK